MPAKLAIGIRWLNMFYTYILESVKFGKYYIGCTNNIETRIDKHNKGYVRSTKAYKPWILVHKEEFKTLSNARHRESQIKGWKSRESIEKLIRAPFVAGPR